MKKLLIALLILTPTIAHAKSTRTRGYIKKDGTYVAPSHKTTPNSTKADNYSTKGNVNPYTGKSGTKNAH